MNWQKLEDMPCVIKVFRDAEDQIKTLTGKEVTVGISKIKLSTKEENKLFLKNLICNYYGLEWARVCERSRKSEVIDARHSYMYIACKFYHEPLQEIAADCGLKNHTTVIHARNKIDGYAGTGDRLITNIQELIKMLPHAPKTN